MHDSSRTDKGLACEPGDHKHYTFQYANNNAKRANYFVSLSAVHFPCPSRTWDHNGPLRARDEAFAFLKRHVVKADTSTSWLLVRVGVRRMRLLRGNCVHRYSCKLTLRILSRGSGMRKTHGTKGSVSTNMCAWSYAGCLHAWPSVQ